MNLPKLNERKSKSNIYQNKLAIEIIKTIENIEKENNYEFEPYEIDNVLLEMIKKNHKSYLRSKFGNDII